MSLDNQAVWWVAGDKGNCMPNSVFRTLFAKKALYEPKYVMNSLNKGKDEEYVCIYELYSDNR